MNLNGLHRENTTYKRPIYGISRLGIMNKAVVFNMNGGLVSKSNSTIGIKEYELSDHLGNVSVVILDRKIFDGDKFAATSVSRTDYYPFGYPIASRSYSLEQYRYGFNGQEGDGEIYGDKVNYAFTYRMYDARIGRFWSVDPLRSDYPWNSTYAFAENSPIAFKELEGLEKKISISFGNDVKYRTTLIKKIDSEIIPANIGKSQIAINELIKILKVKNPESTQLEDIIFLAIFSHGVSNTIFAGGAWLNGVSTYDLDLLKNEIENNNIIFNKNAIIYLGGCNAGTSGEMLDQNNKSEILSFAQRLADITGVTVIAAIDQITPTNESFELETMKYSTGRPKTKDFYSFQKGKEPTNLGPVIDVIKLLEEAIKATETTTNIQPPSDDDSKRTKRPEE